MNTKKTKQKSTKHLRLFCKYTKQDYLTYTQIKKLMGHHDLSRMSNWADEIKSDPAWKKANDWHWCTVPDGEAYEKNKHSGQAVEKINEFIVVLKNKKSTKEEKQVLNYIITDINHLQYTDYDSDK